LLAETAAIPANLLLTLFAASGFTMVEKLQLTPSQCKTSASESGCSPDLDPAAQTLVGESAVTPLPLKKDGGGTWVHAAPFQCKAIPFPTAQTSLLLSADMPITGPKPLNAAFDTTLQLTPFQCSTKIPDELLDPAAQTSLDDTAMIAFKEAPRPTFGPEITLQLAPFQCAINAVNELPEA